MSSDSQSLSKPTLPISKQTHYDVLQISHTAASEEIKAAYRSLVIGCHPDKLPPIISSENNKRHNDFSEDVQILEGLSAIDIDDDSDDETNNENGNGKTEAEKSMLISTESTELKTSNSKEEGTSTQSTSTFHIIQAAYQCLRDPAKRRKYDEVLRRNEEREEWKRKGSSEVNLSEMECDLCCVVDEDNSDEEDDATGDEDTLEKVFFHPCRCGDTFQIVQEELQESISKNGTSMDKNAMFTDRVWQCESCSLTIRINVDTDID